MVPSPPAEYQLAVELLGRGDAPLATLLASSVELDHRRRLAAYMEERLEDPDLVLAAWLLSFPSNILGAIDSVPSVVRDLVDGARRLAHVQGDERVVKTQAQAPPLRAALLLVLDTLLRIDPAGVLRDWTEGFAHDPRRLESTEVLVLDAAHIDLAEQVLIPTADLRGFWLEGKVLRNAVLLQRDRTLFDHITDFVLEAHHRNWGRPAHLRPIELALQVGLRREQLGEPGNTPICAWEWRSVGTIGEQLAAISRRSEWRKALYLCGTVMVHCSDAAACYQVLGELHGTLPYRRQNVRDYLGRPSQSGYRCLATVVTVSGLDQVDTSVTVHITPRHPAFEAYCYVGRERLDSICKDPEGQGVERIRVFTPAGEARALDRVDARVLAFAVSIHGDMLAFATGAVLNQEKKVDLLHPLVDGDEVELVLGKVPRPLPAGWASHFSERTRTHIFRSHRKAFRSAVTEEGRRVLRRELDLSDADSRTLGVLLQQGLASLSDERSGLPKHSLDWWFEQIGLLRGRVRVPEGIAKVRVDPTVVEDLIGHVDRICESILKVQPSAELFMPKDALGKARSMRFCSECQPGKDNALVGTLQALVGGIELVLHREGEDCGEGGAPMGLQDRFSFDQIFLVETDDQPGTAQAVLSVFTDEGVDIIEVVGRRLGPGWGGFRIEVAPIGPGLARILKRRLRALPDVYDVRGPEDGGSPILEAAMPPRMGLAVTPLHFPSPFTCGPEADDDHQFYGRESELGELFDQYRQCRERGASSGRMVFLNGPLRIGKSSIARRFCVLLRRNPHHGAITSVLKARFDEPWSSFRLRLAEQLAQDARQAPLERHARPGELHHAGDLEASIRELCELPSRPTVVLVIDEVHRMMRASGVGAADEVEQILAFRDLVEATPGLMVVWVCPTAATRTLDPRLIAMLHRNAQALPVGPFSLEESTALLSGRNIGFLRTIHLDPKLARHIHKLTGGEPLWLAHLGHAMWLRAARMNSRTVRFDFEQLNRVKLGLLSNADLFDVRIDPDSPEAHDSVVWRTAFELAKAHGRGTRPHSNLTAMEIARRVGGSEGSIHMKQQHIVLELLQNRGAVQPVSSDPVRWQIAVPLLAEYLNRIQA